MTLLVMTQSLSWLNVCLIALLGILLVIVVLVLLVGLMQLMGKVYTREHKVKNVPVPLAISEEEVAAIITALKMYKSDIHDRESEMLTINRITRMYSPWNSKIHSLTQLPERK